MAESSTQQHPSSEPHTESDKLGISSEDHARLAAEDSKAWRAVTGLLLMIVVGGVLLGALAVFLASRH